MLRLRTLQRAFPSARVPRPTSIIYINANCCSSPSSSFSPLRRNFASDATPESSTPESESATPTPTPTGDNPPAAEKKKKKYTKPPREDRIRPYKDPQPSKKDAAALTKAVTDISAKMPQPLAVITTLDHTFAAQQAAGIAPEEMRLPVARAITVSSLTSLCVEPKPLITFNMNLPSTTYDALVACGDFNVHLMMPNKHGIRHAHIFKRGNREVAQAEPGEVDRWDPFVRFQGRGGEEQEGGVKEEGVKEEGVQEEGVKEEREEGQSTENREKGEGKKDGVVKAKRYRGEYGPVPEGTADLGVLLDLKLAPQGNHGERLPQIINREGWWQQFRKEKKAAIAALRGYQQETPADSTTTESTEVGKGEGETGETTTTTGGKQTHHVPMLKGKAQMAMLQCRLVRTIRINPDGSDGQSNNDVAIMVGEVVDTWTYDETLGPKTKHPSVLAYANRQYVAAGLPLIVPDIQDLWWTKKDGWKHKAGQDTTQTETQAQTLS
ncbi:hypothetical protein F4808DRAFT_443256 [Astrocystis sublimbata]|nr:hypothetical protein F4808DRAFT_443256 [Astrocystis sublimbata]